MHKAIELLLKRMESNPYEFIAGGANDRWSSILSQYKSFFTEEEAKEISIKRREVMMQVMHEEIMETLLNTDEGTKKYDFAEDQRQLELNLDATTRSNNRKKFLDIVKGELLNDNSFRSRMP